MRGRRRCTAHDHHEHRPPPAPPRVEEAAVVDAVRAGDETAFGRLTERHRRELHVHCYRMRGSFDEAEDLVQETFLRAWRGRSGFDAGPGLRPWLHRIATNACLDALRRRSRRVAAVARMPAAANDLKAPGDTEFRAFKLDLLRIEDGAIAEITTFNADLFAAFGLPPTL
jgi:DNA-directed RNA polymerase specialized sigma24 family protein